MRSAPRVGIGVFFLLFRTGFITSLLFGSGSGSGYRSGFTRFVFRVIFAPLFFFLLLGPGHLSFLMIVILDLNLDAASGVNDAAGGHLENSHRNSDSETQL